MKISLDNKLMSIQKKNNHFQIDSFLNKKLRLMIPVRMKVVMKSIKNLVKLKK